MVALQQAALRGSAQYSREGDDRSDAGAGQVRPA